MQICVNEVFLGLYSPPDTSGHTLSTVIKDVLTRLMLPISNLRAQTYDGAVNMSGKFNAFQAVISQNYPLALFFHCAAHCANLAAESMADACPLIRDALANVNDLGVLYKHSGKYKNLFDTSANVYESSTTLKTYLPNKMALSCAFLGVRIRSV